MLSISFLVMGCSNENPPVEEPLEEKKDKKETGKNQKLKSPNENSNLESDTSVDTKDADKVTATVNDSREHSSKQDQRTSAKYLAAIVPENMTVAEKKERFKFLLVPAVESVYEELIRQYNETEILIEEGKDTADLLISYKASTNSELLTAMKPHPKSIALAQAAMESAWGTSRFFIEANNIFGVWSFDANEPRIAAGEKRGKKTIWVKKYPSLRASVKDYYRVLARGAAFGEFRELKMQQATPYELVTKLDRYSEKGALYGEELSSMIRFNKFEQYDSE